MAPWNSDLYGIWQSAFNMNLLGMKSLWSEIQLLPCHMRSEMTFYVGPWRFHYLSVLQSSVRWDIRETLAPGIRGVTFVGHGQEFNHYYTPHKLKCSFAVTGISTDSATLNCSHGLQPCVLEWLQFISENQILSKSVETTLLKNHLPMACNAFVSFYSGWVFFLVGYEQNTSHHPN